MPVTSPASAPAQRSLKAVHVIGNLDAAEGGPSYSAPRLCEALARDAGVETSLMSVVGADPAPPDPMARGFADRRFPHDFANAPIMRSLRLSSALERELGLAAGSADIVHSHGLWLAPNIQAGWAARRNGRPLVITPRGMLSPVALSYSRLKKRLFGIALQDRMLRQAACLHVTSEAEYGEVRALGLANPVAIIANGVDLPPRREAATRGDGERTVLSLGRIHPKKGLEQLIRAWAKVETARPGWRLRIVGPAERGHDVELRELAAMLRLSRVSVEPPVYGAGRLAAYRAADLFILPTLNENFAMTVAEALAAEVPVISTTGAPWAGLAHEGCGWWVDQGPAALAANLLTATALPAETRAAMGRRGRDWMEREFSWRRVAGQMRGVYDWLLGEGPPPATVRLD